VKKHQQYVEIVIHCRQRITAALELRFEALHQSRRDFVQPPVAEKGQKMFVDCVAVIACTSPANLRGNVIKIFSDVLTEEGRDGRAKVAVLDPLAKRSPKPDSIIVACRENGFAFSFATAAAGHVCGEAGELRFRVVREADEPPPAAIRLGDFRYGHGLRGGIRFNLAGKRLSIAMRTSSRSYRITRSETCSFAGGNVPIRSHFAIVCVCTPSCSAISLREIRFVRSIVVLSTKFLLTVECRM
jgi:hypothetical protein